MEFTGISSQALAQRREAFKIVYWTDIRGHCFYPKWQFNADMKVRPEVIEILGDLRTRDTVHVLMKFLVPSIGDAGESVLDLILSGRGKEAIEYVQVKE